MYSILKGGSFEDEKFNNFRIRSINTGSPINEWGIINFHFVHKGDRDEGDNQYKRRKGKQFKRYKH